MNNKSTAIIFALNYLNLSPSPDEMLIIGEYDPLYSAHFPKAQFLSPFAGQVTTWTNAGHPLFQHKRPIKTIILHAPQQTTESSFAIASALSIIEPDGIVMLVADNLAGGKTLNKRLMGFGCTTQDLSKQKCRVVWTNSPQTADQDIIKKSLEMGGIQARADGMQTQPGIFSWNHPDIGTQILLRNLPKNLSGNGADFGCGLGDISHFILRHHPDITTLLSIDHDQRAIDCCTKNLSDFAQKTSCIWQDIPTQTTITGLDFIIMNPPFHIGKIEDKNLGKSFITKAANALKPKGKLYMVANAHLPYDTVLQSSFSSVAVVAKENGFKIFEAVR